MQNEPVAVSLDFAAAWLAYRNARYGDKSEADDRALWESFAAQYDDRVPVCVEVLDILKSLLQPDDIVLDVGAGTGRYTLPLARAARRVTALDPSPDMLARLCEKMTAQGISNIDLLETTVEAAELAPHDLVLAAWSLYRQRDILASLRKLVEAARRALVIVDGDSGLFLPGERAHEPARAEVWGKTPGIPNYLYFAGMLWQIGLRAEVRVIHHARAYQGATPREIAEQFAPAAGKPEEIDRFTERLAPLLDKADGVYHYHSTTPVGVVIWQKA
ncbi:MAG: class I SAM-dependent methyltransferase [Anaerolineae bacterium]|nr:class I SAM-dependent methyltransferase [Anaerolineae bacterium]